MRVARYEVTENNHRGHIYRTEHFRADQLTEAFRYQQEHPQSQGWTFYTGINDGESVEPGLHSRAPVED